MRRPRHTLGLHIGHNSASCLFTGRRLAYAEEEERHCKRKDFFGAPWCSLLEALSNAGIGHDEVGSLGISWDLEALQRSRRGLSRLGCDRRARLWARRRLFAVRFKLRVAAALRQEFPTARLVTVPHHLAHALSVVAFRRHEAGGGAALVMDALGEMDSTTAYELTDAEVGGSPLLRWPFEASLGYFYQRWAEALGFRGRQAPGYLMALSGLGDRQSCRAVMREHFLGSSPEGLPWIRPDAFRPAFWRPGDATGCFPASLVRSLGLESLSLGSQAAADIAAAVQEVTEEIVLALAAWLRQKTGSSSISLAGGVFLNCVAVGKLVSSGLFECVLTSPAAHDGGTAVGAGLFAAGGMEHDWERDGGATPFLGGELGEYLEAVTSSSHNLSTSAPEQLAAQMVDDLTAGRLIALAEGRMEFGPRALGGRSILGDASELATVARVNKAKQRFPFQPLAASMDAACAEQLFGVRSPEPYMTAAYSATEAARTACPAAVHADGTCRVHIVGEDSPSCLKLVLAELRRRGLPGVVTNTSLNGKGQPLPRTARDVVETLAELPVDVLYTQELRIEKAALVQSSAIERETARSD